MGPRWYLARRLETVLGTAALMLALLIVGGQPPRGAIAAWYEAWFVEMSDGGPYDLHDLEQSREVIWCQLHLYSVQHGGRVPEPEPDEFWDALTRPTLASGAFCDADHPDALGPYLQRPRVNGFTGSASVDHWPGHAGASWVVDVETAAVYAVVPRVVSVHYPHMDEYGASKWWLVRDIAVRPTRE